MAELNIDGGIFHVEVEGDPSKPVLMLSNSLGMVLSLWDEQMPALLRHFRIVRYDSRGHGGSHGGDAPYSIDRLGQDALAIMDSLEIGRTSFLGLSLGGAVGLWLLVNAPERIGRAVLGNTAARLGTADMWNARIQKVLSGSLDQNADETITRWFDREFVESHPEKIESLKQTLRTISPQGYARSCAALRDMDLRHAIGTVQHPVLVISGADDPVTSAEDIAILAAMPNAKHVVLAARHVSNVEAPRAFDKAVVAFLTSAGTARRGRVPPSSGKARSGDWRTRSGTAPAALRPVVQTAAARKGPSKAATTKAPSAARTVRATSAGKTVRPSSRAARPSSVGKAGAKAAARRATAPQVAPKTPARRRYDPTRGVARGLPRRRHHLEQS